MVTDPLRSPSRELPQVLIWRNFMPAMVRDAMCQAGEAVAALISNRLVQPTEMRPRLRSLDAAPLGIKGTRTTSGVSLDNFTLPTNLRWLVDEADGCAHDDPLNEVG